MTAARSPFELRQVQCADGLYVHARDLVAFLRAWVAELANRADGATGYTLAAVYRYAAKQYASDADHLDLSAIDCVTAEPAPWIPSPDPAA